MAQAKGTFEVKRTAQPAVDMGDGTEAGHFRFDKTFDGPLDAHSVVHMMATMTAVPGSGCYVAIERVVATLDGRSGTFFFRHLGELEQGAPSLDLAVVPDSGTDGLEGLRGKMAIDIVDGQHYYTFEYTLP